MSCLSVRALECDPAPRIPPREAELTRARARITALEAELAGLRDADAAAHEAEALIRTIGESTPDLIYVKDRASRMLYANAATLAVVGRPAEEILSRSDAEWHGNHAEAGAILVTDRRVMERGRAEAVEETFTTPGRASRLFLSTKSPIRDATGAVTGLVAVSREITRQKRAEEHRELLIHELNHRVKNTLATVQSMAALTLRSHCGKSIWDGFQGRLFAMSAAHDLLTREQWEAAELRHVAAQVLQPYSEGAYARQLTVDGPSIRLTPATAVALSMALHELATNAVKYGALSTTAGHVGLSWRTEEGHLHLIWRESGGPAVRPPERSGFGTRLIQRSLAGELGGTASLAFEPRGVTCDIVMPLLHTAPLRS